MKTHYQAVRKGTHYPITRFYDTFAEAVESVEEWFGDYPDKKGDYVVLRTSTEEVQS